MDNFKYLAIVEWAKKYIESEGLKPNDRFLTEKQLCAIHGVSRQTVRQAMMRLESENVICRVRGSGTFVSSRASSPAAAPAKKTVGVISTYFSDYIFPHIVTGIESVLGEAGYSMQLAITHNQVIEETQALESMISSGVCGLIVEPSKSALPNPNMPLYRELRENGVPLVFFNAKYPWADFPCVSMDDEAAGKKVTDHLFDNGHRSIAGIFALDDIQGHKRYSGYMETLLKHNSPAAEQNVLWYSTNERKSFFSVSEDRILNLLNNSSAVVCYNDNIAVSLLSFCKKHGIRVPDDISIVGIDNAKLSRICEVPLTTATHPHQLLGETAAQKLMEAISDPGAYQKDELFIPELIVRKSTKPYKH